MAKKEVDVDGIEADYCAGVMVLRDVAKKHGVTAIAINKLALKNGWVRDLSHMERDCDVKDAPSRPQEPGPDPNVLVRPMKSTEHVDWQAVEADYRAGILTFVQMADKYSTSRGSILRRAEAYKWERNLAPVIKERVKAKIAQLDVAKVIESHAKNFEERSADAIAQAVEQASDAITGIVLKHRKAFAADMERAERIEAKMDEMLGGVAELKDLASLIGGFKAMVEAKAKVMTAERNIYGIDDEKVGGNTEMDEILAMANKLGSIA